MINAKRSFCQTEKIVSIIGLILALVLLLLRPILGYFEWHSLIGYLLGLASIVVFARGFIYAESNIKKKLPIFIIFSNLKLVILVGLIYLLHLAGISAVKLIIGFLTCQTLAILILVVILHIDHASSIQSAKVASANDLNLESQAKK